MKEMLRMNLGMKSNPILREYYNRDVFEKLKQSHLEDNGHDHMSFMYTNFFDAVKKQQREGKIRSDIDCNMIIAMFAALANIDTHKDEIGFEYFPELVHYISEFVMKRPDGTPCEGMTRSGGDGVCSYRQKRDRPVTESRYGYI